MAELALKRWVSKEGLGAALAEAAPTCCWCNRWWLNVPLLAASQRVHVWEGRGAGNGHLKLHFKPFGCQAVNAADPHLAENLIISHGLETGWAQAAPGIALGALGMVWGSIALSNIYLMKG